MIRTRNADSLGSCLPRSVGQHRAVLWCLLSTACIALPASLRALPALSPAVENDGSGASSPGNPPPPASTNLPSGDTPAHGLERWFTDPPQLQLGPVDIHPRFTAGMRYDDNIYITRNNPQSDVIYSIFPAAQFIAGDRQSMAEFRVDNRDLLNLSPLAFITTPSENWPGHLLTLDYGPRANWYTHASRNDGVDQFLTLNTLFPFARLILGVRQTYTYQNTQVIEANRLTPQTTFNTAITSAYQLSARTSIQVNLRRDSISYQAANLLGSADYRNDNWFGYQFSELLNLGGGATFGYVDVQNDTSQTYQQIMGRALYQLAEKVAVDASAGLEFRQFSTDTSGTLEPVFSLTGTYRWRPTTSFRLNAHRWDQASVSSGYNYLMTGFSGGVNQQFLQRYSVDLSGGWDTYAYSSYTGVPQSIASRNDNNYWSVRLAFEFRFNPFLKASAYYRYAQQNYQTGNNGFTDNQIGLSATYGF